MSTTLPVTFKASPIPSGLKGKPQVFFDEFTKRLSIQSDENFSIFVSGPTAPSSNVGPWLKDGSQWYVWDSVLGTYVPEVLGYFAGPSTSTPSPSLYDLWIVTNNTTGVPESLKYWNPTASAWQDVYATQLAAYSNTTAMNIAITNAIAAQSVIDANKRQQYPMRARKAAAAQIYTAGTGDEQIVFEAEDFDIGANYNTATNEFTAPIDGYYTIKASAYVFLDTGTPTGIDRQLKVRVNGVAVARKNVQVSDQTGGATIDISVTYQLSAGDVVDIVVNVVSTGASTWSILNDSTNTFFEVSRKIHN